MGGPSTKDYSPVPTQEQIDDGVDAPRDEADVSDDEGLYNTSAPLLSGRTRGNEPPPTRKKSWLEFLRAREWPVLSRAGRNPSSPRWTFSSSPKSTRSWLKIFITTFVGLLIAAVVGLSISTAVLAKRPSQCRSYYTPSRTRTWLPLNNAWRSANNRLNFAAVYPPLTSRPMSACQTAWNSLSYIPCHEKIWNRAWDDGKHQSLFDPDYSMYAGPMCTAPCQREVTRAYQLILSRCTSDDKFDMDNYSGPFLADAGLESGPVEAITTLERRLQHTCRESPVSDRYRYQNTYCTADMWADWFIVDGMNTGNLEGLDLFESKTRVARTERSQYRYNGNGNEDCDNAYYGGSRYISERRYGPGVNQTSCSWCTIDWFDRKLQSWSKGEILDPKTGKAVSLKGYLIKIKSVGQRCDADAWNRIYKKALDKYKSLGLLPPHWDGDDDIHKP